LLDVVAENSAVVDMSEKHMDWMRRKLSRMQELAEEALWFANTVQLADLAAWVAEISYIKAGGYSVIAEWDQLLNRLPSLMQLCTTDHSAQAIQTVYGAALLERALVEEQEGPKLRWLDSAAVHFERQIAVSQDEYHRCNQQVQLGRVYVLRSTIRRDVKGVDAGLVTMLEAARHYADMANVAGGIGRLVEHARQAISEFGSDRSFLPSGAEWLNRWRWSAVNGVRFHVNSVIEAAKHGANRGERQHPIRYLYDTAIRGAELLVELGHVDDAVVMLERGRLLALGLALDRQRQDDAARTLGRPDLVERRAWLAQEVTALELALTHPGQPAGDRSFISDLARRHRAELESLDSEIISLTQIDSTEVDNETMRHAAAITPLLYIFATEIGGHAILVRPKGPPRHVEWARWDDAGDYQLHPIEVVRQWRYASSTEHDAGRARWRGQVETTLEWLAKEFVRPLEAVLDPLDNLVIVPCGIMAELPLHAALLERSDGSLRTVRYAATARTLIQRHHDLTAIRATNLKSGLLAVAVPYARHRPGSGGLVTALPLAECARRSFAGRPTQLLASSEASIATVKACLPNFAVAHFSCHGRAEVNDPLSGGLELVDGRLTLDEILDLRLHRARLAVVAACEGSLSGHALPDELESVATGLVEVGFPGVIAGMWEIQERAIFHLLSRFYEEWAKDPFADPAQNFSTAVRWLRSATLKDVEAYPVPGERPVRRTHPTPELLARLAYPDADCWAGLAYYGV
jgi:CHAT domain-containing protein